jgi:hypothetical protein
VILNTGLSSEQPLILVVNLTPFDKLIKSGLKKHSILASVGVGKVNLHFVSPTKGINGFEGLLS